MTAFEYDSEPYEVRVLAVDPGGHTGLAYGTIEILHRRLQFHVADAREITPYDLHGILLCLRPDVVVCESFEYRNDSRSGLVLESRNLIGACQIYAEEAKNTAQVVMQTASQGLGGFNNDVLKRMGVYTRGTNMEHARDATRHLLYYSTRGQGSKWTFKNPKSLDKVKARQQ